MIKFEIEFPHIMLYEEIKICRLYYIMEKIKQDCEEIIKREEEYNKNKSKRLVGRPKKYETIEEYKKSKLISANKRYHARTDIAHGIRGRRKIIA